MAVKLLLDKFNSQISATSAYTITWTDVQVFVLSCSLPGIVLDIYQNAAISLQTFSFTFLVFFP